MPEIEARIAVLEASQRFMQQQLAEMSSKVNEMHEVLLQARGAKWAILGVAGLAGFLAGKVSMFASFFTGRM